MHGSWVFVHPPSCENVTGSINFRTTAEQSPEPERPLQAHPSRGGSTRETSTGMAANFPTCAAQRDIESRYVFNGGGFDFVHLALGPAGHAGGVRPWEFDWKRPGAFHWRWPHFGAGNVGVPVARGWEHSTGLDSFEPSAARR